MALLSTVCVLVIMVCNFTVSDDTLANSATFKKCFKGTALRTLYNLSFKKCGSECKLRPKCAAANYWRQRQKCELVDGDNMTTPELAVVGDYCVSIARSDLPEVDGCRECRDENQCASKNDSCERIECPSLTVGNGIVKGNMQNVGARQKVICKNNFKLEPANARPVCEANGSWSDVPQCRAIINCSEPIMMDNAALDSGDKHEGAMRTYTCDENYITARGSNTISVTCTNTGDWSQPTETCLRNCSEPILIDNANLDTGDTHEGAMRKYTCHDNYITATGSKTVAVNCTHTGYWTSPIETCLRNCSEPSMIDHAILDTGLTHENTVRTYTCSDGYITATGLSTVSVTCSSSGQWTTPTETCLKSCGNPPNVAHSTVLPGAVHEGTTRNVLCDNHYSPKQNGIISYGSTVTSMACQSSGDWDSVECVLACEESADLVTGSSSLCNNDCITASNNDGGFGPLFGRFNSKFAWMTVINDSPQYLQFTLRHTSIINEIATQGSPLTDINWWVTTYKVHYSADCNSFTEYNQIFNGNTDGSSNVTNEISPVILAKCVRVNPLEWQGNIAMRVELRGCIA